MSENKDYRMAFVRSLETSLVSVLSSDQLHMVVDAAMKTLNDYEITERTTDIVPAESINERIMKRYLACMLVDGKSEKTIYQYKRSIQNFSDFAHGKPFTEMGAYDIRYYLACEKERGISNRTLENKRANLSALFQWMTIEEIIPKNPIMALKPIKYVDEVRKPFSEIEIDALRTACRNLKERALIEVLLSTGVRVSELFLMDIRDIDMSTLVVHVRHGKGGKERYTYITSVGAMHLDRYLKSRKDKDSPYLFGNNKRTRLEPDGIRRILNGIAERASVENVHPHRFRRTFATSLARRGMEIQEIQRLLGHSDINTTMRYVCIDDTKVQASYRKYIA